MFTYLLSLHDDVILWKHFPPYWPFVRGIHWSLLNSPHKCQWRGALFSLICAWMNAWVNNKEAGDLRCHGAHYDIIVVCQELCMSDACLSLYSKDDTQCFFIKSPFDFMFLYRFVRRRRPQILVHAITFEQLFGFLSFLPRLLALTYRLTD